MEDTQNNILRKTSDSSKPSIANPKSSMKAGAKSQCVEAPAQIYSGERDRWGGRKWWDHYRLKVVINPDDDSS